MSKYLITASLLNSFSYYLQDEWKAPQDSRADFLKTLSREKFEPNEAMQKGIDFEEAVKLYCDSEGFLGLDPIISPQAVLLSLRDDKGVPLYTRPEGLEIGSKIGHLNPLNDFEVVVNTAFLNVLVSKKKDINQLLLWRIVFKLVICPN